MKFSIITPTHNRPEQLQRCIESVIDNQDYSSETQYSVEHIIINDSPDYDYSTIEKHIDFIRHTYNQSIIYIKNAKNMGKNYSCNLALSKIEIDYKAQGHYIIFLDDDDWLAPGSISDIAKVLCDYKITKNIDISWLVTNRAQIIDSKAEDTTQLKSLTINKTGRNIINYFWDCMIYKRFYGDATHIIEASLAKRSSLPMHIKNGEEWYFFMRLCNGFIYRNLNSTITNGYLDGGLTDVLVKSYNKNTVNLWREKQTYKTFLYLLLRSTRVLIKRYL